MNIRFAISTFLLIFYFCIQSSIAQVSTSQFTVQITITASCHISSATNLDFGSNGVIITNIDASSALTVQCTNSTPYNIGLNSGKGTGATVTNRLMTGPASSTIRYTLYTTSSRTLVWGNTVGTDTVTGKGNGAQQVYTIYGRVAQQATPAPGVYTDTVTATINY